MFPLKIKTKYSYSIRPASLALSRLWLVGLALCLALTLIGQQVVPASALAPLAKTRTPKSGGGGAANASGVLAAVNAVRASYGLAAFQSNGALNAAAQAHSNYMASVGASSHSGSGGSDPKSRALAAGYGGGADVSVTENIYAGMNASAQQAVNWWQGDGLHLDTMTSARYTDAGVGAAVGSDGTVYYTLDVGVVVGGEAPAVSTASGSTGGTSGGASGTASGTSVASSPLLQSTPNADGSIIHVVQAGQTLWTIAAIYKMDINDLLTINNMYPTSMIQPGQKITIRPAGEAPSPTPEGSATPEPTRTPRPTATPIPRPTSAAALVATQGMTSVDLSAGAVVQGERHGPDLVLIGIGLLVLGGGLLLVVGNLLKRVG